MKSLQDTNFIEIAPFREVTDINDGVIMASKFRRNVKNDDVRSQSKIAQSFPNFADFNIL